MNTEKIGIKTYASVNEAEVRRERTDMMRNCPIPEEQMLSNVGLFLNSKDLARILFMDFLYRQIIDVQGIVVEFGTRWGQNVSLFSALRGLYEPFNRHRKIVGFDTFEGFPSVTAKDGTSDLMVTGNLTVSDNYEQYLERIMELQELESPLAHIRKFEIRKGNAVKEIDSYLSEHPETIIAMAYFDFDLYEPTRKCLERIRPYLVKGSVIGFDELNDPDSPGETRALAEVFGLNSVALKRYRYASRVSYFVVE
jgi:hypothetical protein